MVRGKPGEYAVVSTGCFDSGLLFVYSHLSDLAEKVGKRVLEFPSLIREWSPSVRQLMKQHPQESACVSQDISMDDNTLVTTLMESLR